MSKFFEKMGSFSGYSHFMAISLCFLVSWFAVGLFLYGYFPMKHIPSNTVLDPPSHISDVRVNAINLYPANVQRLVMVVIDALRFDFVNEKNMPYLFKHVRSQTGCLMKMKAETPTVTMPRIKALTTGSLPQFIDVILNFWSSKIQKDSFLLRAKDLRKKLIFFGDDTWLQLFPHMFVRHDGVNSFYVNDFTVVDTNVTRHLTTELAITDWDMMFLHYLGLDHIGHVYGSNSPHIREKLREMDEIIRRIHTAMIERGNNTVILVCGDHGMKNEGGHGGSTKEETIVPLALLGVHCRNDMSELAMQTDVAPTVSVLMGMPLPSDSIGRVLLPLLNDYTFEMVLYVLHYNAINMMRKDPTNYEKEFRDAIRLHSSYLKNLDPWMGDQAQYLYQTSMEKISEDFVRMTTKQTTSFLYIAFCILVMCFLGILRPMDTKFYLRVLALVMLAFPFDFIFEQESIFEATVLILAAVFNVAAILPKLLLATRDRAWNLAGLLLTGGTVVQTLSLSGTSFIESEELVWYFFLSSFLLLLMYESIKVSSKNTLIWFLMMVVFRFVRNLNYFKNMWSEDHGLSSYVLVIFTIGIFGVCLTCYFHQRNGILTLFSTTTLMCVFWFRNSQHGKYQSVYEARAAMALVVLTAAINSYVHKNGYHTFTVFWVLWCSLLLKPYNLVLIPVCYFSSWMLRKINLSVEHLVLAHLWLGSVLFHCQGHTNHLASIDITPGYIGLTHYSPIITMLQVVFHTYAFPVLSLAYLFGSLRDEERVIMFRVLALCRVGTVGFFCLTSIIQKSHISVWTVFSPKLIIECCHTTVLFVFLFVYNVIKFSNSYLSPNVLIDRLRYKLYY